MKTWRKLGRVFAAEQGEFGQTPTPLVMDDRVRIFFASRDHQNHSYIRFVDLNRRDPTIVLGAPSERCLGPGTLGAADMHGQMPSFASRNDDGTFELLYSGWTSLAGGCYQNCTMIALSDDGTVFHRPFQGPLLDRTPAEPYLAVTPCVVDESTLFYISGLRWEMVDLPSPSEKYPDGPFGQRPEPVYTVRMGVIEDDGTVSRFSDVTVLQRGARECFSRPWVVHDEGHYRMWYSYRAIDDYRDGPGAYRIGYAKTDLLPSFTRLDGRAGLEPGGPGEWDEKAQCYPAVFDVEGKRYMAYNGNSFGKFGFGLAVLEDA